MKTFTKNLATCQMNAHSYILPSLSKCLSLLAEGSWDDCQIYKTHISSVQRQRKQGWRTSRARSWTNEEQVELD